MAHGITLHMFIGQGPCGDACIYPAWRCRRGLEAATAPTDAEARAAEPRVKRQLTKAQPGENCSTSNRERQPHMYMSRSCWQCLSTHVAPSSWRTALCATSAGMSSLCNGSFQCCLCPGQTGAKALQYTRSCAYPTTAMEPVLTSNSRPLQDLRSLDIASKEQAASGASQCIKQSSASCPLDEVSDNLACRACKLSGSAGHANVCEGGAQCSNFTAYQPGSHAEQSTAEAHFSEVSNRPDLSSHLNPSRPQPRVEHGTSGSKITGGDVGVTATACSMHDVPAGKDGRAGDNLGALRRKPGRGEPTLSLSCSDKLARWGMLGLQVSAC